MSKEISVPEKVIYVCGGSSCKKRGGKELRKLFKEMRKSLGKDVEVIKTGCTDNCKNAPVVCVQPDNKWFGRTTPDQAMEICEKIRKGNLDQE